MFEKGCKPGPGRPKKDTETRTVQRIIENTAPKAAEYLQGVTEGKEKPNSARIDVCKYLINQSIGMPKQRQELTGEDGNDIILKVIYDQRNNGTPQEPTPETGAIP